MEFYTIDELISLGAYPMEMLPHIKRTCQCGEPMVSNIELTQRRCSNPNCKYYMRHRIVALCKEFGIVGVGPETALSYINCRGLKNQFQVIPLIFGDKKPLIDLWKIAKYAYVPGISDGWKPLLRKYSKFGEFFKEHPEYLEVCRDQLGMMLQSEKYFRIKPGLNADNVINITIHGHISGYKNREAFVEYLNSIIGQFIYINYIKSPVKYADYCVTEHPGEIGTRKVAMAIDPTTKTLLVSPEEFKMIIMKLLTDMYERTIS